MIDPYDHIEDYLAGKLVGEELSIFEAALQSDQELRALVDNFSAVKNASGALLERELLSEVEQASAVISDSTFQATRMDSKPEGSENAALFKWFLVGLLMFGFMMGVFYLMKSLNQSDQPTTTGELVAQAYIEPLWPNTRGDGSQLSTAIGEFEFGDRKRAKAILLDSMEQKVAGRYWLSELYFKEGKSDSTLLYLPSTQDYPSKKDRINFLKTLSYIMQNNKEEAKAASALLPPQLLTSDLKAYLSY